jgi:hypothetical protein
MTNPETVRLADYNRMVDTYRNESDRAAAILATSFVDNTLRRLLLEYMVEHPKITALFEGDRPLATFSSRITLAFGLGMLRHDTYTDYISSAGFETTSRTPRKRSPLAPPQFGNGAQNFGSSRRGLKMVSSPKVSPLRFEISSY